MRTLLIYLLIGLLLYASHTFSDVIIIAPDTKEGLAVAKKIQLKMPFPVVINPSAIPKNSVLVSLGYESALTAVSRAQPNTNVIASFITPTLASTLSRKDVNIFPIYSEPDPHQVISFLEKNFDRATIGYLYSNNDDEYLKHLSSAAVDSNITLHAVKTDKVFRGLRKLVKNHSTAILINKNEDIYTPQNIRYVLEAAYRKRIPVIATSPSLIKAGAMATISISEKRSIEQIIRKVTLLYENALPTKKPLNYVAEVTVRKNPSMEKVYGIWLNTEEAGK